MVSLLLAAGRRIRDEIENKFERSYYLKTPEWGALTRRWPQGYSVWEEDEKLEEGYKLLKVRQTSAAGREWVGILRARCGIRRLCCRGGGGAGRESQGG